MQRCSRTVAAEYGAHNRYILHERRKHHRQHRLSYNYDYNKANGGGVYCRGSLELSGSPVIEGNKLTTGESNNLVSYMNKTKITDTLNSDAKIYVYMKDTSTQDQTLATVDPSYLI